MKFAWLPCSLILRQEQGRKRNRSSEYPKGLVVCQGNSKYRENLIVPLQILSDIYQTFIGHQSAIQTPLESRI